MCQPDLSHASASARPRLDIIYCNQRTAEQLDRHMQASALEWKPGLSAHRAVFFARQAPQRVSEGERPLPELAIQHPDFPRQVALNYYGKIKDSPNATNIEHFGFLKDAMREVAARLVLTGSTPSAATSMEDRL
eukprot:3050460-Pyramimonas_sp.AAC.1